MEKERGGGSVSWANAERTTPRENVRVVSRRQDHRLPIHRRRGCGRGRGRRHRRHRRCFPNLASQKVVLVKKVHGTAPSPLMLFRRDMYRQSKRMPTAKGDFALFFLSFFLPFFRARVRAGWWSASSSLSRTSPVGETPRQTTAVTGAVVAAAVAAARAAATAGVAAVAARARVIPRVAAGADGHGQALEDGAALLVPGRIHAVVDGEVAADEVSTHGGVLPRHRLALVEAVGLVLAMVDPDPAAVLPRRRLTGLIQRIRPVAPAAETCRSKNSQPERPLDKTHPSPRPDVPGDTWRWSPTKRRRPRWDLEKEGDVGHRCGMVRLGGPRGIYKASS